MICKEQNKILDAKIESNINLYKVDRLKAEVSAFSSGDLNKYNFLTRNDLKYKPNALDKARFGISPLGKAFSVRLDKTVPNYQKEGVIKLLAGDNRPNNDDNRPNNNDNRPNNDDNRPNNDDNRPNNDANDEEKFNYEEELEKLEELDKRFKRLINKKCLASKEKINDNDSDDSDDSKYLKKK